MLKFEINDKGGGRMDAYGSPKDLTENMLRAISWLYHEFEDIEPGMGSYLRAILGAAVADDECPVWTEDQDRQGVRIDLQERES